MTYKQLSDWLQKYNSITQLRVADELYIVRPLTLYEILFIMERQIEPTYWTTPFGEPKWAFFAEDSIVEIVTNCILWPEAPDLESKAGTASSLFVYLYQQSLLNDQDIKTLVQVSESKMQNKMMFLKAMILAGFSALKPSDVDNMNMFQLFDTAALSTIVLKLRNPQATPSLEPLTKIQKQKKSNGIDFDAENERMKKGGKLEGDLDPLATKRAQAGR